MNYYPKVVKTSLEGILIETILKFHGTLEIGKMELFEGSTIR